MIAGFDPSVTHFGFVLLDESKADSKSAFIESGTFKTSPKDGLLVQRLIMQRERVRQLLISKQIKFISMESPYLMDFNTEVLFALNQYIHEVFLNLGMFVIYLQPQSLKKLAIPGTNPNEINKHHMTHQAKTELDKHGTKFSEHEADAYFAGKVGLRFHQWFFQHKITDDQLEEHERSVFCGKHTFTRGAKAGITEYTGLIYRENDQFFDYSKQIRNTSTITKEVQDGK